MVYFVDVSINRLLHIFPLNSFIPSTVRLAFGMSHTNRHLCGNLVQISAKKLAKVIFTFSARFRNEKSSILFKL